MKKTSFIKVASLFGAEFDEILFFLIGTATDLKFERIICCVLSASFCRDRKT